MGERGRERWGREGGGSEGGGGEREGEVGGVGGGGRGRVEWQGEKRWKDSGSMWLKKEQI